jgi:DNA-binding response OmpR family regulator
VVCDQQLRYDAIILDLDVTQTDGLTVLGALA